MTGTQIGFMAWSLFGCLMIGLGVFAHFTRKTMGFWANAKVPEMTDVKNYNRAVGRLFCVFGIVFILLGLPLLAGQNSALIIVSVIGVMIETIVTMAVYSLGIEEKYKKK